MSLFPTYADDALGANELDEQVGHGALGVALGVGLEVAEITDMAGLIGAVTVSLVVGVDCRTQKSAVHSPREANRRGCRLTVRAGRGAAVGVVAKGVDVETALGVGVVAADVPGDGGRGRLGLLLEDDGAGDLGVTTEDGNCQERARWLANANTRCFPIWTSSLCS
jgi:hypothetical protein